MWLVQDKMLMLFLWKGRHYDIAPFGTLLESIVGLKFLKTLIVDIRIDGLQV